MIKAQIIIEMKDGALYTYANHFLEEKDDKAYDFFNKLKQSVANQLIIVIG